jgi:hypothetical protein
LRFPNTGGRRFLHRVRQTPGTEESGFLPAVRYTCDCRSRILQ